MKEVMDFLRDNKVYYLATSDGGRPHVRAMGFIMEWRGKAAFCTSNQKEMYRQIVANPYVEICCVDEESNTLRLSGKAVRATTEEAQRKAIETLPWLSNIYSVGDGRFEIFCLEEAQAFCQTMAGEKKVLPV